MKIEITAKGLYGAEGEIPIGTVMEVKEEPKGLAGRYRVVSGGGKGKTEVTNPKADDTEIKAIHHGGGKFNVVTGKTVLLSGLSKEDADALNSMSQEDRAAYVEAEKAKAGSEPTGE